MEQQDYNSYMGRLETLMAPAVNVFTCHCYWLYCSAWIPSQLMQVRVLAGELSARHQKFALTDCMILRTLVTLTPF